MDKLAFMLGMTLFGAGGAMLGRPFLGVAVYYLFALLRPQFLWEWILPRDVTWSFYVALATMGSAAVWRAGYVASPTYKVPTKLPAWNAGHLTLGLFMYWMVVTYVMADSQAVAYPYFEEYLKIFIMLAAAAAVITKISQIWTLYLIITFSLGYVALEANELYFLRGGYLFIYYNGFCGLDNNGAALMLALAVPICLYLWDGLQHRLRWAILAIIPLIIHAILTSYSRGAMLTLALSIPLYWVRCRRKGQLSVILLLGFVMVLAMAGEEIRARFFTIGTAAQTDESAQARLTSWSIAWRLANENPILGVGIRNSNRFTFAYGADMEGRTIHSQYLQIAADCGMVGMVAYIACLVAAWWMTHNTRRAVRNRDDWHSNRIYMMACGLEGAMFAFAFGSVFLSLENFEPIYLLMMLSAQLWAVTQCSHLPPIATVRPAGEAAVGDPSHSLVPA